MKDCEILAPAGSKGALEVAVNVGANAVYLGLSSFNARKKADNFDETNVVEIFRYAHLRGVKVYVTVNTLVNDNELHKFLETVRTAYRAGADAFIIQDLGAAQLIKSAFPDAVLHASTQMGIHNAEGAKFAESFGFKRVVLARETKLKDIEEIKAQTNLEIEFFVQGALCVGFSGNCYLSSLKCGESGNRGECLQLCRMPYTAIYNGEKKREGYWLSASDLSLLEALPDLMKAGVTSFKIEGRMRRPIYVAAAIRAVKNAIRGEISYEELIRAFNRGAYNKRAYLDAGTPDVIINPKNQNHVGIKIGWVKSIKPFKDNLYRITIRSDCPIIAGDGLKFFDNGTEVGSLGVGNVERKENEYILVSKTRVKEGLSVNLIYSSKAEKIETDNAANNKVKIDFDATAEVDSPFKLKAVVNGCYVDVAVGEKLQKAEKRETTYSDIAEQLGRLGNTDFELGKLKVSASGVFVPKSTLNAARREAVERLYAEFSKTERESETVDFSSIIDGKNIGDRNEEVSNIRVVSVCRDESIKEYPKIFDGKTVVAVRIAEADNVRAIVTKISKTIDGSNVAFELPPITTGRETQVLNSILGEFPQIKTLVVNNVGAFFYGKLGYKLIGGVYLNVFNGVTANVLKERGIFSVVRSFESESGTRFGMPYVYGFPALMRLSHCPYKTVLGGGCADCKYNGRLSYELNGKTYPIIREKIGECRFVLRSDTAVSRAKFGDYGYYELR